MFRDLRRAVMAVVVLAISGSAASAQYYPRGYGAYGWGGWGAGGGTVASNNAQGLGMLAAGAGVYNQQTAEANQLNLQTAIQWNEYLYQSQQESNRLWTEKLNRDRKFSRELAAANADRLRNNPTQADINRGDALNVALDEISNPKVYLRGLQGSKRVFEGTKIRELPFQYAAGAITVSVDDLTKNGPPDILKAPDFDADRAALRAVGATLREQAHDQKPIDPALVAEAKGRIKAIRTTLQSNSAKFRKGSPDYRKAENYLKGLNGLITMLETPAINVLLAGVEKRPDTTVGDLLSFMRSFNLRFGVASTPQQRAVYAELYPSLVSLRQEVVASNAPPVATAARDHTRPGEFFSGMEFEHFDAKKTPPPPAPGPKK